MQSETHPSYGHISVKRQSSNRPNLFGTVASGYNSITLEISEAAFQHEETRGCYITPVKRLIEVTMSPLQFAELIGSLNCAEGQPCTITWREGIGHIKPSEKYTTRLGLLTESFTREMAKLGQDCQEILHMARTLKDKPHINKSDREDFVKLAEQMVAKITMQTPHISKEFSEVIEKMRAEAKLNG